jgi:hypothetical protein
MTNIANKRDVAAVSIQFPLTFSDLYVMRVKKIVVIHG